MSIITRDHNRGPEESKTPRPIRERLAKINMAFASTIRAVEFEKAQAPKGDGQLMFRPSYARLATGHEVVAPSHSVTRVAKASPVVAESIDKMEVTSKPSGKIDLNERPEIDPNLFHAMADDNDGFEAKVDSPKIATQDEPDKPTISVADQERNARILKFRRAADESSMTMEEAHAHLEEAA